MFAAIHYNEIGLKGGNRSFFEKKLVENIQKALGKIPGSKVKRMSGMILFEFKNKKDKAKVQDKLGKVFGISNFSFAEEVKQDLESFKKKAMELLKKEKFNTFAVRTQRTNKNFPLKSMKIEREVGDYILQNSKGKKVNLGNPDITCHIAIVEKRAFIYFEKIKGPGGLPVGTAGKVISLLSGGFDSPVAAWRMMKRGAEVVFVHFYSYPNTSKSSIEKVKELAKILSEYQGGAKIYLIPFLDIQKKILASAPAKLRVILYRRFMVRIAEMAAEREKALGLVTGDSLGQVASQTLENMRAVSEVATLPIFRPLIGDDKQEIIELSKKIDTHDISKEPFDDCCSLFTPAHPETRANLQFVKKSEQNLEIDLVNILDKVEIVEF